MAPNYQYSSHTSVTIPYGVTKIGVYAFYNCIGLKSVTFLNPEPPTCKEYVFYYDERVGRQYAATFLTLDYIFQKVRLTNTK